MYMYRLLLLILNKNKKNSNDNSTEFNTRPYIFPFTILRVPAGHLPKINIIIFTTNTVNRTRGYQM